MAGRPKEQKLIRVLRRRARSELGREASGIDYVISWVESGKTIAELAKDLANEMGESCSRSWLSGVVDRQPEDKARITAARTEAAHILVEDAIRIADEPAESTVDVQRNRLRAETRTRIAGWWNRAEYGEKAGVQLNLNLPQLHLEALRVRNLERQNVEPMTDVEVIPSNNVPALLGPGAPETGAE